MPDLICSNKECGNIFLADRKERKFCCKDCYSKSMLGKKMLPHVREIALKNLLLPKRPRFAEDNNKWKGDSVGYRAIHYWVIRQKGKPNSCSLCGKNNGRMHWANIDHKYKRNVEDYFAACPPCHYEHDRKFREGRCRKQYS